MPSLSWHWTFRSLPLAPVGVVGQGAVAAVLLRKLLQCTDEHLAELAGVQGDSLLIILSTEATLLPWADGVIYLGRDPAAPGLLIPTTLVPSIPLPLLEKALQRHFPSLAMPLAVFGETTVSLSDCRKPISHTLLQNTKLQKTIKGIL